MRHEYVSDRLRHLKLDNHFGDAQGSIYRFAGLEHIVGRENVDAHTISCRVTAASLPISEPKWRLLDRILELHDGAEIIVGDVLSQDKNRLMRRRERVAIDLLNIPTEDKNYIKGFETAKSVLVRGDRSQRVSDVDLLAVAVDFSDAAQLFHIHTPAWFDSSEYSSEKKPSTRTLTYAVNVALEYIRNLSKLDVDGSDAYLANGILVYFLSWATGHWGQVPRERVPWRMKRALRKATNEMKRQEKLGINPDRPPGLDNFVNMPKDMF